MFHWYTEISASLMRNKLRTFLTGFAVGWGILLLILLLGTGTGLRHGLEANSDAIGMRSGSSSLHCYETRLPYAGYERGRTIQLYDTDIQLLQRKFPEIESIYPQLNKWVDNASMEGEVISANFGLELRAVFPEYDEEIQQVPIVEGRFITVGDMKSRARNVVIDDKTARSLRPNGGSVLGKLIFLGPFSYTVVGVYRLSGSRNAVCYLPFTTMAAQFPDEGVAYSNLYLYCPSITQEADFEHLEQRVRQTLALVKEFSPEDDWAVYMSNDTLSTSDMMGKIFFGLDVFLWFIGLSILTIGVIGVSNIMLVSVQERMREFGIRKALGAHPKHIIGMVLAESVFVTLISGLLGLILAVALLWGADYYLATSGIGSRQIFEGVTLIFFQNPVIPPWVAVTSLTVMVISGVLAGYMPARKAVRIPAIVAMREQ
ncbi:hypothetical protein HQ36_05565 [Porphyromonas gingivicanis]|uniref:ABC transporter permease n=1 Tax=Porphyromonas gingivicanis TaxID=266762 RepID=A0A0A2G5N2_9PORP|nr:ABC transporter permease [Porphyromonas gingivicanis]KGN97737.1 hypothetical protein HQ36_05565 [Porphyromonas gingivicanis]